MAKDDSSSLDKTQDRPLYLQLADKIRNEIDLKEWAVGSPIPSENGPSRFLRQNAVRATRKAPAAPKRSPGHVFLLSMKLDLCDRTQKNGIWMAVGAAKD